MSQAGVTASWLRSEVYPRLDAAELLTDLNPRRRGNSYTLDCPVCNRERRAFYYPGSSVVCCNSREHCGARCSIWDAVETCAGGTRYEIAQRLCAAAGVSMPGGDTPTVTPERATMQALQQVLGDELAKSEPAIQYLKERRGLTDDDISSLGLGYYPGPKRVAARVKDAGGDTSLLREWSVLPPMGDPSPMSGRIVGYWIQPDGSLRLWGRAISDDRRPKYCFTEGLDKTRPYGYQRSLGPVLAVEGAMDRHALELLGVPACATGGNQVNAAQAAYLAADGVQSLIFLCDSGKAARDGVLRTIQVCEPVGIRTAFAVLHEGDDDVDAMRRAGRYDDVQSLAADAINGGAYLARQVLLHLDDYSEFEAGIVASHFRLRHMMTDESSAMFDRLLSSFGVLPRPREETVMGLASEMLKSGMSQGKINEQLQRRFGVDLMISPGRST